MATILNVATITGAAPGMVSRFVYSAGDCCQETRQRIENIKPVGGQARNLSTYPPLTGIPKPLFTTILKSVEGVTSKSGNALRPPHLENRCLAYF